MPLVPVRPGPPPTRTLPEWQETTIVFRLASGGVIAEDGYKYGTLVVHPTLPAEKEVLFALTHMYTRHSAILRVKEIEDGIACAERLWDRCGPLLANNDEIDPVKVPADVVEWIKRCDKERKCVA